MDSNSLVIDPLKDQDFETVNQTNGVENGFCQGLKKQHLALACVDSLGLA